jgi:hypothetical protein
MGKSSSPKQARSSMLFRAARWIAKEQKISANVHHRAGSQAAKDFAQLLDADGKIG